MKRSTRLFVVCMLAVQMSLVTAGMVRSDDGVIPGPGDGSSGVVEWIVSGFKFFVDHYQGIDLLEWSRRK